MRNIYEKYLITEEYQIDEAMSAGKALKKLEDKLKNADSMIEVRLASAMIVQFIKKFKDEYTDEVSTKLTDLLAKAKARAK